MDNMSPQQQQQQQDGVSLQDNKRRMKSQSCRRQSAPSLVISKALTRSKTLSRESFLVPVCPENCPLVQSFLSGPDRSFLLHGHAQLKTGMQTQGRHLFLFNDILVIAKAKSANHFKQKAQVCVCEMWTAGCIDEVCEGSTDPERSFVLGWPTCNCVATFSSAEQKERWLSVLKSRIKEEKEKEEPKTIPLRVYGKGINTFAVTKTLPVSNSDSANEVVRLALQQFSVIGNVKDFQLWVISKRDNAPYPLIGHEFPFSIQMSHVRHTMSQGGGGRDADRQRAMQVEQLQVHKQCQFIMRPRPSGALHVSAELSQKPLKRSSLITWAFWRGSSSHLNELSLAGTSRGCLFGQPLSSVCVEDALPKPVMDMLAFLYHEGSWTRGIFRRPAGARAVRELRDSLDAGNFQLPLTRDNVFIIAGVFKDFLRSIPGSLLCCELHEEWMDVLEEAEEEEEEEQVQDIQRMIRRLPKDNALLLRYLLAMLHGIQGNAQENQMTSFNLSVCIAPSMLWPPGVPSSPEVEGEGAKKVCELVKFMIEHCQQILQQDPSSLFGVQPRRLNADDMASDTSYDSLENELDNSSGGSPSFCSRSRLRPKLLQGSLESILTFSDNDTGPETQQTQTDSLRSPMLYPLEGTRVRTQDPPTVDTSPTLDLMSLDCQHRQRRRSEPAIAYVAKFCPYVSGSSDGLAGEDEELSKKPSGEMRRSGGDSMLNLETSSSSLSSTSTSPAPTPSPLYSLDSVGGDHNSATRRGLYPTKTHLPSTPFTKSSALTPGENPDLVTCAKGSPPKEPLNLGTLKCCRGLHPNSWMKKGRRLSLTQQENLEKEEDNTGQGGEKRTSCKASKDARGDTGGGHVRGTPGHEPHKLQHLKQDSDSPLTIGPLRTINAKAKSEGNELKQPSPNLFYKQSGPSLSLFKQNKSHSIKEKCDARLCHRRRSEPGQQVVERASARARLPSDPGLKVPEGDTQGGTAEARLCLSPYATKAVREYFSSHPHSNTESSQKVALALVESRREWLRRCSDPTAEPADFDQLLFAEESFV